MKNLGIVSRKKLYLKSQYTANDALVFIKGNGMNLSAEKVI